MRGMISKYLKVTKYLRYENQRAELAISWY